MNTKKVIITNIALLTFCCIIPKPQIEVAMKEEQAEIQMAVVTEVPEETQITNRSEVDRQQIIKNYIVNNETDLRTKSNVSIEEYQKMLENTALYAIAESFYNAEQKFGVNGLYLIQILQKIETIFLVGTPLIVTREKQVILQVKMNVLCL